MRKLLILSMIILVIFTLPSCSKTTQNTLQQQNNNLCTDTSSEHTDSNTIISKDENINVFKDYAALKSDGTLTLFNDYDAAVSLCNDAFGEFFNSIKDKQEANFSPYIKNPILIKYMQYRVKNHIYGYSENKKYKFFVTKVNFCDEYVLVEGIFATYTNNSMCMEGTTNFIIKNLKGRCVITEWYWDGMESPDVNLRGEFSIDNNIDYWDKNSKYDSVMNQLGIAC